MRRGERRAARMRSPLPGGQAVTLLSSADLKDGGNRKLVSVSWYFPGSLFVGASVGTQTGCAKAWHGGGTQRGVSAQPHSMGTQYPK